MSDGPISIEYDRKYANVEQTIVESSKVRDATKKEIKEASDKFKTTGQCDHSVVQDKACWPYYVRSCVTCGKGLGTV